MSAAQAASLAGRSRGGIIFRRRQTFLINIRCSPGVPRWPDGRVTFLGDAVHTLMPAGGQAPARSARWSRSWRLSAVPAAAVLDDPRDDEPAN
jgi:hypothetical protein